MPQKKKIDEMPEEANEVEEVVEAQEVDLEEELKEKWQRAMAELENTRKRFAQERISITRFANEELISELLPVIDNFYRATEHVPDEQKSSSWVVGIQYIQKQLLDILEQQGLKELDVKPGQSFNLAQEEAIGTVEQDGEEDLVVEVKTRGYNLHEKILRPAQVIVSKKSTK